MKLLEIARFEISQQTRRPITWLYFTLLTIVSFLFVRKNFLSDALYGDFFVNSPFIIASVTVFCSLFWFLAAGAVTGEAAARDPETRIDPLVYTAPIRKHEYLGGRLLAALVLQALILLAPSLGVLLAVTLPGIEAEAVGPFRPAAYLTAYGFLALPTAFIATSIQFAWATLSRRSLAAYLGSIVLFFVAYGGMILIGIFVGSMEMAMFLDVFGHVYITDDLILGWTPVQKNTRLITLEGALLRSRIFWMSIAVGALALTYRRFRFEHAAEGGWWNRLPGFRRVERTEGGRDARHHTGTITVPAAPRTFGPATHVRQTLEIARTSFLAIAKSRGGLVVLLALAAAAVLVLPENLESLGTPMEPRTGYLLTFLTAPITQPMTPWLVIPLLIILWTGELVWRERDAGLGELSDAAPIPEAALFLGKLFGVGLMLATWEVIVALAAVAIQLRLGYHDFEIGLSLLVLLGLQLPQYLLFAVLALAIHGIVNQKYVGHFAVLVVYALILFAPWLGIGHRMLVYGSAPGWRYSDLRGFGPTLTPWLWFMAYWAAWALLIAVAGSLVWMRGLEGGIGARLRLARFRLRGAAVTAAVVSVALIAALGGFIFYNTNVLNDYVTPAEARKLRADYERLYGRYAGIPQPALRGAKLEVELHPERRTVEIEGTYALVNETGESIDRIHVATASRHGTGAITFDRKSTAEVVDALLRHRVYALEEPLRPGESLELRFSVDYEPRGFTNSGVNPFISKKATFFRSDSVMPAIGYQPSRELLGPAERREAGLPARPLFPLAGEGGEDITGESGDLTASRGIAFEAVIGTAGDQIAVAPGTLRRTWSEGGRRYFHYATDVPVGNEWTFSSAPYAVREEAWVSKSDPRHHPVSIQVYHHSKYAANLERIVRSARASLDSYTQAFGPYPWSYVRLVQNPGLGNGAHAAAAMIDFTEGFTRFDPPDDPRALDMPFAIVAHEMAHQWWGAQLAYAYAEGAPLLSESAAWYAAMGVIEETYGRDHLRRLLRFFRQPNPIPPIRQSVPLLRAMDPWAAYRKGPFALFAMSETIGRDRVDLAFRRLLEKQKKGGPPARSVDLYRELEAVTPDEHRQLLHDLFAANTFWDLETNRATVRQAGAGTWEVTLEVRARKVTVDPEGVETEVPLDQMVEVGVFAPGPPGADFGETLYLGKHRIRTGTQTITVTVPKKPADAGVDPFHVLIELERFDNVERVKME